MQRLNTEDIRCEKRTAVDPQTLIAAAEIVEAVRSGGEPAVRLYGERFGEISANDRLVIGRPELGCGVPGKDTGEP